MRGKLSLSLAVAIAWIGAIGYPVLAQKTSGNLAAIEGSTQMMVVTTADWNAVNGWLQRFERPDSDSAWSRVGEPFQVVAGEKGMGWGIGIVPVEELRGGNDPVKREGDKKSPAGVFTLGTAFGFSTRPPAGSKVPYLPLTSSIDCVDDPQSNRYNTIADRSSVTPDWNSAEHMLAVGEAYRWGVVVDQNSEPVKKNAGSCVFMHVWSGAGHGTAGCTAMPREQIETVLAWLNPAKRPLLVQMPANEYMRIKKALGLPALHASNTHQAQP